MAKKGLINSLNALREISSPIYHQYIPVLTEDSDISAFSTPILEYPEIYNEFTGRLLNKLVYSQLETKIFNNPLKMLEGDEIPAGYIGEEIYINPAQARQYNVDDFAGLLFKYESDVKVQYQHINSELQYVATVARQKLVQAFVSWDSLERYINGITMSLYNGAYIDEYRNTKNIISSAYKQNNVITKKTDAITTEEQAKAFVTMARNLYLSFQTPSSEYNAWEQVGGYGRKIVTWTDPEDIVILIRNDIRSFLDVNVMANAFNIDATTLLGQIISVDNFNIEGQNGEILFDGSNILGFIGDRKWFKNRKQDMTMDFFYNPNNRTTQFYLNIVKMYNSSLFANGVVLATELPNVPTVDFTVPNTNLVVGNNTVLIQTTPGSSNSELTAELVTSDETVTLQVIDNKHISVITTKDSNTPLQLKITSGTIQKTINFTITK